MRQYDELCFPLFASGGSVGEVRSTNNLRPFFIQTTRKEQRACIIGQKHAKTLAPLLFSSLARMENAK